MYNGIRKLIHQQRKEFRGMKFLCHTHDGWTDANHNGVIGTSLKIINHDMVCIPIAAGLIHYNEPHKSELVAAELNWFNMERYGIELSKICLYSASNTANGAKKVSFFIEAFQEDCEMHIGQLVIQYAIGHKENRGMVEEVDEDGKVVKKRGITINVRIAQCAKKCILCLSGRDYKISCIVTQKCTSGACCHECIFGLLCN